MPLASLIIALVVCVGLWLEQRALHCHCGRWLVWISDVNSRHCSQHLFDPYSFTHFLHGVLFFGGLWTLRNHLTPKQRWLACLILEGVWELIENTPFVIERYRTATIALGYQGDSIINSMGDLISCGLGYLVAQRVSWRKSVAMFLIVECVLLVAIRDSLLLNVIMLLWPLEIIKQWQQGAG